MDLPEGVYLIPGLLSPDECAEYIAFTEARGYEAAPITTAGGFELRPDVRNNTRVIVDDAGRADALWQRARSEVPGFYRYDPGERFAPHRDGAFRRDNGEVSLLTVLVYLNDGFAGGETVVQGFPVTPERGTALVFEHQLLHEGAAVTSGRKYVLRSDVMFGRVGQVRG